MRTPKEKTLMSYWVSLEEEASGTPNEVCGFEIVDELVVPLQFALGGDGLWELNGKIGGEATPLIRSGLRHLASNPQPVGLNWDQSVRARFTLEYMYSLSTQYTNCFWAID
jgi:hypothetical protein